MESDSERLARIAVTVPNEGVRRLLTDRFLGTPGVDEVQREIERDGDFARSLSFSVYGDNFQDIHAGGNVKIKGRYQIGKFQVGTGGLVSGVALLVLALGGGTVAVVANSGAAVALSTAVGRWEQPGGSMPVDGFETHPTVLTITESGEFRFSLGFTMSPPTGFPTGMAVPRDIGVDCKGTVTPEGDQFVLRTTSGTCGTFSAKPTRDGTIMDVFVTNGSVDGSIALRKKR